MRRKLLSAMLGLSMAASMAMPAMTAFAADGTQTITQTKPDASCEVTINGGDSTFSVTIPKTITGSGDSGTMNYTVEISGDIAGDEQIVVTPAISVELAQSKKAPVTATITQDKKTWACDELDTVGNGEITYQNVKAGTYTGTFNFNIGLENIH